MSLTFIRILFGFLLLVPGATVASINSGIGSKESLNLPGFRESRDAIVWSDVQPQSYRTDVWEIEITPVFPPSNTPHPTRLAILPLVKQDGNTPAPYQEPLLEPELIQETLTPSPTLTPTYIPPQGSSTNYPIVFGAMVIVIVIVSAWFAASRSELRSRHS